MHQEFGEHVNELRRRLIWVLTLFVITLGATLYYAESIARSIIEYHFKNDILFAQNPISGIHIWLQVAVTSALIITFPAILYHTWKFVEPALGQGERRSAFRYLCASILLFLFGSAFGFFFIFEHIYAFMKSVNLQLGLSLMFDIYKVFAVLFNITIPMGLIFEFPVLILFLTKLRLLTPAILRNNRRYAYLLIVIIGCMITPPDIISHLSAAIPLLILYEVSIMLSSFAYKQRL